MRLLALILCLIPTLSHANDWDSLRLPGAIAIMRHALAPGGGDPANHTIGDCTTQRNLSDAGRMQARRTGEALRANGISFDKVFSSQWCRTTHTAELLGYGPVIDTPALNSFFGNRQREPAQTSDLRKLLAAASGLNIWVTHQVNISALTGTPTRSGEIIVFRLTDVGTQVLGRILIAP